jgi:polar amino acid transport system permease protein
MEKGFLDWLYYCGTLLPFLLEGLKITLKLFFATIILSLPLGLIIALLNISKFPPFKLFASTYVWIMRGTPLLLQLFFVFYGLPFLRLPFLHYIGIPDAIGITLDRFPAAVFTFVLNYGAYFSEIIRAGILSIDDGQYEAAKAAGMTNFKTMQRIIIPQTIRRIIPPIANETITLIKDTALVTSIGVMELLQAAKSSVNRDVNTTAFFLAAVMYLVLTLILTYIFKSIEKQHSKHEIR